MSPDLERDGMVLRNTHSEDECSHRTACVVHNPSNHSMRQMPLHWRGDRGIFERICAHGVGHPDPDQKEYWAETNQSWQSVHGCDGCCG